MRVLIASALASVVACVALAPGCRAPSAGERAIDELTAGMTEAVRSRDAEAYLALVDLGDPYFAHEQRFWAREMAKGTGAPAFEVRRDGRGVEHISDLGALMVAPLAFAWRPSEGADERRVAFDARFTGGAEDLRYAGPVWVESKNDGVSVLAPQGMQAEAIAVRDAYTRAMVRARAFFEGLDEPAPPVKVYAEMAHLQLSIAPTYDPPLGGWYEPGESIKLLWRDQRSPDSLETALAHELGHAWFFAMGAMRDETPWWAHEGVAESAADPEGLPAVNERLSKRLRDEGLPAFETLAVFDDDTFLDQTLAYPMGHSIVSWVIEGYGRERAFVWLLALGPEGVEGATRRVLGRSFDSLDGAWRDAVRAHPAAGASEDSSDTAPGAGSPSVSAVGGAS